jgi:hypothetical protein
MKSTFQIGRNRICSQPAHQLKKENKGWKRAEMRVAGRLPDPTWLQLSPVSQSRAVGGQLLTIRNPETDRWQS